MSFTMQISFVGIVCVVLALIGYHLTTTLPYSSDDCEMTYNRGRYHDIPMTSDLNMPASELKKKGIVKIASHDVVLFTIRQVFTIVN